MEPWNHWTLFPGGLRERTSEGSRPVIHDAHPRGLDPEGGDRIANQIEVIGNLLQEDANFAVP
jgi:hypothetical protein